MDCVDRNRGVSGLECTDPVSFDLAALAGFGWALWMIYELWRDRQKDKD